jgi:hypothetical protein
MAQILLATRRRRRRIKQLARETGLLRQLNVLEDVALSQDFRAGIGFEGVVAVGVEVVVYGVEEGVAADFGATARGVVDVVLLKRDHVVGAGEVDSPVVKAVAGRGPAGRAVDVAVGDGDAVGRRVAEDNVLAGDEVGGYVVDPDEVAWVC